MPSRFMSDEQLARYGRYFGNPNEEQLGRHFHLDAADRELVGTMRGAHNRLGFAVQLGTARFLGAFLDDPTQTPPAVIAAMARQLGEAAPPCLDAYRYSRFCELYRGWEARLSVTMRQSHWAAEELFVDYAGDTVPVVLDRLTGQRRGAQIFVAVLGASSFLYAEATWTQALVDWIEAHNRALAAIGGVPALLVPDNTKVAVIKACLYDPVINRTYADMAAHYGAAVLPARPYKPRDKARVEVGVLIAERWLLGRLRHTTFYSLAELNTAIAEFCRRLNDDRVIRRVGQTREFIQAATLAERATALPITQGTSRPSAPSARQ